MDEFEYPFTVGVIITKGKNEVVETYSNVNYKAANAGAKYIPEGHFCRYDTDGSDNMLLADTTNAYCISMSATPIDTGIENWGNPQPTQYGKQTFCLRADNISVAFEDSDVGNGSIGDPVYVSANGKATLVATTGQNNIGILKSPIAASGRDSRGRTIGALAYIDFFAKQLVIGA